MPARRCSFEDFDPSTLSPTKRKKYYDDEDNPRRPLRCLQLQPALPTDNHIEDDGDIVLSSSNHHFTNDNRSYRNMTHTSSKFLRGCLNDGESESESERRNNSTMLRNNGDDPISGISINSSDSDTDSDTNSDSEEDIQSGLQYNITSNTEGNHSLVFNLGHLALMSTDFKFEYSLNNVSTPFAVSLDSFNQNAKYYEDFLTSSNSLQTSHQSMTSSHQSMTSSHQSMTSYSQSNPTTKEDRELLRSPKDECGNTELHLRIMAKDEAGALVIIKRATDFEDLNVCNEFGQRPMHLAVLYDQEKVLRRLICAGGLVSEMDVNGNTPLHLASRLGRADLAKQLLQPIHYKETLENRYKLPYQMIPQDLYVLNDDNQSCLDLATTDDVYEVLCEYLLD